METRIHSRPRRNTPGPNTDESASPKLTGTENSFSAINEKRNRSKREGIHSRFHSPLTNYELRLTNFRNLLQENFSIATEFHLSDPMDLQHLLLRTR